MSLLTNTISAFHQNRTLPLRFRGSDHDIYTVGLDLAKKAINEMEQNKTQASTIVCFIQTVTKELKQNNDLVHRVLIVLSNLVFES